MTTATTTKRPHVREGQHTPWGGAQTVECFAPGIDFVSTVGHGGIHLEPRRQAKVRRELPLFETFAGGPWYEEDQDAAVPILVFASEFSDDECLNAVRSVDDCIRCCDELLRHAQQRGAPAAEIQVAGGHFFSVRRERASRVAWVSVRDWIASDKGAEVRFRADRARQRRGGSWERGSLWTLSPEQRRRYQDLIKSEPREK